MGLAAFVGCRQRESIPPPLPEPPPAIRQNPVQMLEIGRNGNIIAQISEMVEVKAVVHLAGEDRPRESIVRLHIGTWLLPETLFTPPYPQPNPQANPLPAPPPQPQQL
ncbi:MAG: hypothetical protein LIP23_10375, partial [Planctomycetes bacterium]|nr:hypothetical protein [Planctomycetota bacterium]